MTDFNCGKNQDNIAQTGTALAQCCVAGHICQLVVIIIDAKPDTLLS